MKRAKVNKSLQNAIEMNHLKGHLNQTTIVLAQPLLCRWQISSKLTLYVPSVQCALFSLRHYSIGSAWEPSSTLAPRPHSAVGYLPPPGLSEIITQDSMDTSSISTDQSSHSSFYFFPNYESHFPGTDGHGNSNSSNTAKKLVEMTAEWSLYRYQTRTKMKQPPFFRFKHPSSSIESIESNVATRQAATDRILAYIFEATCNSYDIHINPLSFNDDLLLSSHSTGPLSSHLHHSQTGPSLVNLIKKIWRS
ncbi:hypothetical protein PCASD_05870 [Puccinia coronata f. sp. avenae]|uniref:Uncharacterized protein n=1 Tax=Puccinia coronata f. sp. avenae TaxID=200324 RepID=A0A2N5V3Y8_9BASI|nr:hypothetical protein PCASD_05870 [Puccinia coronata f. sp. avenae]